MLSDFRPRSGSSRKLTVLSLVLIVTGAVFMVTGFVDFFGSMGDRGPPTLFWCLFVGIPLLGGGVALFKFANLGWLARYKAESLAPVAKDTINYVAEGVEPTLQRVAQTLRGPAPQAAETVAVRTVKCPRCRVANDRDAHFCKACAAPVQRVCTGCGEKNAEDARFCDHCGKPFAG